MAIAGRVAIVPKGEYQSGAQYKRLDLVTKDGRTYVCKAEVTTADPTVETDWMFLIESDASSIARVKQQVNDIVSGTTKVGNADTLDGHDSTYFATAQALADVVSGATKVGASTTADVATNATNAENADKLDNHDSTYFATAESVTNIVNGTTKVGNADTLDGKHASEFALLSGANFTGRISTSNEIDLYNGTNDTPEVIFHQQNGNKFKIDGLSEGSNNAFRVYSTDANNNYTGTVLYLKDGTKDGYLFDNLLLTSNNISNHKSGDSSRLDGHSASEFVQIVNLGETETDTKTCVGGYSSHVIYRCTHWIDYPTDAADGQGTLIAINYAGAGTAGVDQMWCRQIFVSPHTNTSWSRNIGNLGISPWEKDKDGGNANTLDGKHASDFALLSGAEFSNRIVIKKTDSSVASVSVRNSSRQASFAVSADSHIGIWDDTNKNWVMSSTPDGAVTIGHQLFTNAGFTVMKQDGANEGGEITMEKAVNSTLQGNVTIDIWMNKLRFIEMGGNLRGAYIDLAGCKNNVASEILHTGNSAKTVISSTAPSDTSAYWIDSSNENTPVGKVYLNGAWRTVQ